MSRRAHTVHARPEERETKREAGVAERVNSCVVVSYLGRATSFPLLLPLLRPPSSSLSLFSPFRSPSAATLHRRTARFKYQRRLKSDLYHAESCYLYRLIRDLPVRYFEATPHLAPVLTEALTSFGTKAATAILTIASTGGGGLENIHPSLALRPPPPGGKVADPSPRNRGRLCFSVSAERERERGREILLPAKSEASSP